MSLAGDALRGAHLHFDCAAGAAGDMTLGALFDLGVPVEVVREAIGALGVDGGCLRVARIVKRGISAVDVKVVGEGDGHHHHDEHGHHHHDHHHYTAIRARIEAAELYTDVKDRALDMFARVARAEATIHGTTVDEVAFHEVGALDSIVDIVGTAAALAWLRPSGVTAVSVAMGHGSFACAHGVLPVPAPAALAILTEAGGVIADGGVETELCTPTGAAILASAVTGWSEMPTMTPLAIGYGAGDSELGDRANVLRVVAGKPVAAAAGDMFRIEANIDDMTAELCEHVGAALFTAGAVDVWWTPITMKRSRPALQLSALAPESALDAVLTTVLRETTSIGVRFDRVARRVLDREHIEVDTPYGPLPVKVGKLGGDVVNVAPEYEACRQAAVTHEVPLKQVFAAVIAAYHQRQS